MRYMERLAHDLAKVMEAHEVSAEGQQAITDFVKKEVLGSYRNGQEAGGKKPKRPEKRARD